MLMRGNLARNTSNREFSQKVFLATDLFRVPKTLVLSILLFKHISLEFPSAGFLVRHRHSILLLTAPIRPNQQSGDLLQQVNGAISFSVQNSKDTRTLFSTQCYTPTHSAGGEVAMIRLRVALLVTSLLFVPLSSNAQRRVALAGNVYFGDESHPAGNISVSLENTSEGHFATQSTNGAGQFRFGSLQPATYVLKIDETGFEPVNETVDVSLSPDKDVKICLRPTPKNPQYRKGSVVSLHELSMPDKAREYMESGKKKLYQGKDTAGALADFQHAISIAPGYYEAYYQAGMDYLALGNRADAEKSFRKAVELSDDKYGEADVGVGILMLDRGIFADAEKMIRRGLQLNPNFWLGHYELGRALVNEKRLPEAELSAIQARLLAPTTPIVYRLLSLIHLAQKNYPALLEDIDTYLALDPDSPAGQRAKQFRDQLQQKLAAEHFAPASGKP